MRILAGERLPPLVLTPPSSRYGENVDLLLLAEAPMLGILRLRPDGFGLLVFFGYCEAMLDSYMFSSILLLALCFSKV